LFLQVDAKGGKKWEKRSKPTYIPPPLQEKRRYIYTLKKKRARCCTHDQLRFSGKKDESELGEMR